MGLPIKFYSFFWNSQMIFFTWMEILEDAPYITRITLGEILVYKKLH